VEKIKGENMNETTSLSILIALQNIDRSLKKIADSLDDISRKK
jgi:hypothetical protein